MACRLISNRLHALFITSSFFFLHGCASLDTLMSAADIREPSVNLAGTQVSALSFDGAELTMLLNIDNPNPLPIKLAGFDYAVNVNGKPFTQGQQHSGVDIDARASSQVKVPVAFKFSELANLFDGKENRDELAYSIDTNVRVDLPILGIVSIPATHKNRIPIPAMPSIQVSDVNINSLGFSGADLTVVIAVENPNTFGIDLTQLDYNLLVNGTSWATIKSTDVLKLPEKGKTQINIPVQLSFADMGQALFQALTQGKAMEYKLNGDMTVDTTLPLFKNVQIPLVHVGAFEAR